jgi:hypothetical protein
MKCIKECKNCKVETEHRFIKDIRKNYKGYYSCCKCLEENCKRHRKKHWDRYLAQKANTRKRSGSIKIEAHHVKELQIKQNNKCILTGVEFDIESKWYRPSLDRIDSNKGYTIDNIRLVSWISNHSRGSLTDEEFIEMCKKISDNHKEKIQ